MREMPMVWPMYGMPMVWPMYEISMCEIPMIEQWFTQWKPSCRGEVAEYAFRMCQSRTITNINHHQHRTSPTLPPPLPSPLPSPLPYHCPPIDIVWVIGFGHGVWVIGFGHWVWSLGLVIGFGNAGEVRCWAQFRVPIVHDKPMIQVTSPT